MNRTDPRRFRPWIVAIVLTLLAPAAQGGMEEGMKFYGDHKYVEAAAEFQALVEQSPGYAFGYFMLGLCDFKLEQPEDGEKHLARAIELDGDKFKYHAALANVYGQQARYAEMVATLDRSEKPLSEADRFDFHRLRGLAEASLKDWAAAIGDLEQAVQIKPDPAVLTQLGKAYYRNGQYENSVDTLRAATASKPDDAERYSLIADALLELATSATSDGQRKAYYDDALSAAQMQLELRPTAGDARYLVARAALGAGKYETAIEILDGVLSQEPHHCTAMVNLGAAQIARKAWNDALQALDRATNCDPRIASAWQNKALVLQTQGGESRSIETYRAAIRAYEQAEQLEASATNAQGLEACRKNIEAIEHNDLVARLEREQEADAAEAQAEFERKMRAQKEWERKQEERN